MGKKLFVGTSTPPARTSRAASWTSAKRGSAPTTSGPAARVA